MDGIVHLERHGGLAATVCHVHSDKKHEFDMDFGVVPWLSLASGGACERTCGLGWYRPPGEHVMRLSAASPQLMSRASSDPGSTIDCGQLEDASDPMSSQVQTNP